VLVFVKDFNCGGFFGCGFVPVDFVFALLQPSDILQNSNVNEVILIKS
jgi:hypothetical protein